jgi:hypothetical protein
MRDHPFYYQPFELQGSPNPWGVHPFSADPSPGAHTSIVQRADACDMWDHPFYYQPFERQGSPNPWGGTFMVGGPITKGSCEHSAKGKRPLTPWAYLEHLACTWSSVARALLIQIIPKGPAGMASTRVAETVSTKDWNCTPHPHRVDARGLPEEEGGTAQRALKNPHAAGVTCGITPSTTSLSGGRALPAPGGCIHGRRTHHQGVIRA